jgi:pimeloyl-ACP methyl ester carboxylesterase
MSKDLIVESGLCYMEDGEGRPIVLLHGLMGTLSNFEGIIDYFPKHGYKVMIPELPIYSLPLLKTNVKNLALHVKKFIEHKNIKDPILLGNSLGGHVALYLCKHYMEIVGSLVLTGSSGLYEKSFGDTYPKRGNREYIQEKTEKVFYDPKVATKELVDTVYQIVNNRSKTFRTLAIAKSSIRHNMAKDLPNMNVPVCVIWGKNDNVTTPEVAIGLERLLPDANLFWIDKCGHAPMMEHPDTFNQILHDWLKDRSL